MNKLQWEKQGLILEPNLSLDWLSAWAGASCAVPMDTEGNFRIYITGKDIYNRSRIGTAILNVKSLAISELSEKPLIDLGERGTFDENGTSYPFVLTKDNKYQLYYLGWVEGVQVPWYNGLGLALSSDGINFKKFSKAPVFERNHSDYLGVGSMFIISEENKLKMWYSRFESWGKDAGDHKHFYNIKYAESKDGVNWNRFNNICIDFKDRKSEYAIAKPSVLKLSGKYYMWYSYRGISYQIGFAVSDDGINWRRYDDYAGIGYSNEGWDSQMQCYAYVFEFEDKLWMLYNGNDYGASGLGIACIAKKDFIKSTGNL